MVDLVAALRYRNPAPNSVPLTPAPLNQTGPHHGVKRRRSRPSLTMLDIDELIQSESSAAPSSGVIGADGQSRETTLPVSGDITNIDEYLARPEVQTLRKFPKDVTAPKKQNDKAASIYADPVELGTTGNADTGEFHELCQRRGIVPAFTFTQVSEQEFSGTLAFSSHTIPDDDNRGEIGPFPSKRDVKEALSARGLAFLKTLPDAISELQDANWTGALQIICQNLSSPAGRTPIYTTFALGLSVFSIECELPTFPRDGPLITLPAVVPTFGSRNTPFPSKKLARVAAARAAYLFLASHGVVRSHPAVSVPPLKKQRVSAPSIEVAPTASSQADDEPLSVGQRCVALCTRLSLPFPTHRIDKVQGSDSLYSGAAFFSWPGGDDKHPPIDERLRGPVGEIRQVYGKKAAKEECTRKVVAVLERLRAERERMKM